VKFLPGKFRSCSQFHSELASAQDCTAKYCECTGTPSPSKPCILVALTEQVREVDAYPFFLDIMQGFDQDQIFGFRPAPDLRPNHCHNGCSGFHRASNWLIWLTL